MGTSKFFTCITHFDFVDRCFLQEVLGGDMFHSFRVFVSKFFLFVFGSVVAYIFSFKAGKCYEQNQVDTSSCGSLEIDEFGVEDNCFQVCNRELVSEIDEQKEKSVVVETASASSTNKYEFSSGQHISGFMEEPKTSIFSVQELYMGSSDSIKSDNMNSLVDTEEDFDQEKAEDYLENIMRKQEMETFNENEEKAFTEYKFLRNYDSPGEVPYLLQDCSLPVDNSELDKADSSVVTEGLAAESILDQANSMVEDQMFDSDDDYIELKPEFRNSSVLDEDMLSIEDLKGAKDKYEEKDLVHEETRALDSVLSEESQLKNSSILDEEVLSSEDLNEAEDNQELQNLVCEATHPVQSSLESEESSLEHQTEFDEDYDDEDEDEDDEFSLEHQDLIEQLKMELKSARTGGLPTIMEECESPKMVEELKPLKFDKKFEYKDRVVEIHKFYRSYLNKMRKLDVLNSQTMHAIGLLKLKDPVQLIKAQKSGVPAIKFLSQNLWSCKPRRHEADPNLKLIGELHKDFELVYVGQLCLSWEILHWQYRKAFELLEYDAQEFRQYNQVASDFQLFQVLLQRFVENEPFQGRPRVENYVKDRRAHCNLLQVPVIREDSLKDRTGRRTDEEDTTITNSMLTEIIAESMRVFWEFLRADKDETDVILRGPELHDSIDSELLTDIRTEFQKKEKKLKEILRSGGCIVKRLQKHPEKRLNYGMFLAQVELKLVSKVLNMSRLTTDQLVWCHEKLAKFKFSNRKLHLEASFLLFPC